MVAVYVLLILMIVGALVAIEVRDLLSSVVAVGAVGLGVALISLILKAPDVAITQLVVEIIAVVILIRATLRLHLPGSPATSHFAGGLIAIVFVLEMLRVASGTLDQMAPFGEPLMRVSGTYLREGLTSTGAVNIVSAILLDYRAYDTLGEATVLFTAVLGVLAVVRRVGRREIETKAENRDA